MSKEVKNLFDTHSKDWDEKYKNDDQLVSRINKFVHFVNKYSEPKNLLDVGCTSGIFLI